LRKKEQKKKMPFAPASNSRFKKLPVFRLLNALFSRRMFYLGRQNSARLHRQLREAAKRCVQFIITIPNKSNYDI